MEFVFYRVKGGPKGLRLSQVSRRSVGRCRMVAVTAIVARDAARSAVSITVKNSGA